MTFWFKKKSKVVFEKGGCSDVGLVRSENQDAFGYFPENAPADAPEHLFIVADGMGGHAGGQQASRMALDVVSTTYFRRAGHPVEQRLADAFRAANAEIHAQSTGAVGRGRPGTTCTALALSAGRLYIAHVGDSRAYRIRQAGIAALTTDHTVVEQLRQDGILSSEEAKHHTQRNVLSRAMGIEPELDVDIMQVEAPVSGDRYLLCTDGLAKLTEQELRETVLAYAPQEACERLVALSNDRGGNDNATALVVYFP